MAKSKPIGVRFNEELLNKLIESGIASSAQKVLILYERVFMQNQTIADYFHKPTSFQAPINFAGLKGTDTSALTEQMKVHFASITPVVDQKKLNEVRDKKMRERQYPLKPEDVFNKPERGDKESIIDYKIRIAQNFKL